MEESMYNPTEFEKNVCLRIVKEIIGTDDSNRCEEYVAKVFATTYSTGGDYGEGTLRAVAETLLKDV